MIIKRISIGNQTIVRREIVLPSGKVILLKNGQSYVTSDPDELNFIRTLKGVQIHEVSDKELRAFVNKLPDVPTVDKDMTEEEAKKYLWHDEDEDYVIEVLKEKGYISDIVGADPEEIRLAKLKLRFNKISDSDIVQELKRRSETTDLSDEIKKMITTSSESNDGLNQTSDSNSEIEDEKLFQLMKSRGYVGWRKSSKT
jgi:hypothetical protein